MDHALQIGTDREVETDRIPKLTLHRLRDIHPHDTHRRAPAHADAGSDVELKLFPAERIAAVGEDGGAPLLEEVAFELDAADREMRAADDNARLVRGADLLIVEAANGPIAARVEAQVRR